MPSSSHSGPPAIVLGTGITALGTMRVLARGGTPVVSAGASHDPLVTRSRWYRPAHLEGHWDPRQGLAANLRRLDLDTGVLLPCSDSLAMEVADLPEELAGRFLSYQPSLDTLRKLVDKGELLGVLQAADVPHPRTHLVDDDSDIEGVPSGPSTRPFFIKPRDSQSFFHDTGRKGIHAGSRSELEEGVRRLTEAGHRLIVQEYVPGPASDHYFVDGFARKGGEIVASLTRRRLRMYPPDFGNSSLVVTVEPEVGSEAVRALGRLFRAVGYRGIFSAEFKRDTDDGVFRLLEVNARPWWYIEFAARAGLDVATMTYTAALGRRQAPVPGRAYQVGRKLVYPYYDLHACLETYDSRLKALWRFTRDGLGADDAVFAWDDPAPAVYRWKDIGTRTIRSRLRRLRLRAGS